MKKVMRSVFSIILAAAMLCTGISCYAAGDTSGLVYVSLGDSIADGIGLPANPLRGPDQVNKSLVYCNKTEGAYPVLVAQQLGISDSNFYQLACAGMRTVELRYCLDQSYAMPNKDAHNFQGDELQTWVLNRFNYVDLVKNADIVSMNMCANDIATCTLFAVRSAMASSGVSSALLNDLTEDAIACGEYFTALAELLRYASQLDSYRRILTAAIQGLSEGYTRWTENWDAICKRIYELNPDVTLVCIGMYNPFAGIKLSGDSLVEIGYALDGIVASIDSWAAAGSAYAEKYTYVSIMGIESMFAEQGKTFTDEDFLDNLELNVHPSLNGQSQIADKTVKAIMAANVVPSPAQSVAELTKSHIQQVVGNASRAVTKTVSRLLSIFK